MKYLIKFFLLITVVLLLFTSCSGFNYDKVVREELFKREEGKINKIFETKTKLELPLRTFGRDFAYIQPKSYTIGIYPIQNETKSKKIPLNIQRIILTAGYKLVSSPIAYSKLRFVNVNFLEDRYYLTMYRRGFVPPKILFSIEGSITEYDTIIESYNDFGADVTFGGGSTTTDAGSSFNRSEGITVLTLDLNFFNKRINSLLPLGYSSNSLVLARKGKGNAFYLYILGNGITLGRDIYVINSTSLGIRFLTEFSLIQLLGRIDTLPYWHCLKEKHIRDVLLIRYMREEWYKLSEKRKLLRLSKVAKLYFGYYVAKKLPYDIRGRVSFDIETEEGRENTKILIKLIKKFYRLEKTDLFEFNSYLYIWEKSPFCSYPYDRELERFLDKHITLTKFKLSKKFNLTMATVLDW